MNATRFLLRTSVLACATALHAQTLVRSVNGPAALARFGKACLLIPDQNGDGVKDVLLGAPGFNSGRGAIYCVSGAYLMTGVGASSLWSLAPTANAGDEFGTAIDDVGDVTGDGVRDYAVGQPGYDNPSSSTAGAVRLVNGATRTVVSLIQGSGFAALGTSLAACGDVNGNGVADLAVGAPAAGVTGMVFVLDGSSLDTSDFVSFVAIRTISGTSNDWSVGQSVSGGKDLTGDGVPDILIGAPHSDGPNTALDSGLVILFNPATSTSKKIYSSVLGEHFGTSVSVGDDYDGDGVADVVVGAPDFQNGTGYRIGRAVVLSGARIAALQQPYEMRSIPFASSVLPPPTHNDPDPNFRFGASVRAVADLNGDGVGDYMVGAPDFFTAAFPSGWNFRGVVRIYSGATGTQLSSIAGSATDKLGDGPGCSIGDLNGDGLRELIVTGSLADAGGTDSGVLRCYRLFPIAAVPYCIAKVNSLGCSPSVGSSGTASATSGAPFLVTCSQVINQKQGLLFYSHTPAIIPFQGGTKCVRAPAARTPIQDSGGSLVGNDCSGGFSLDFNARIASGIDPTLSSGSEVYAQFWSRDPASVSTTSPSNAIQFVINP